jgi:hypothetical protein
MTLKLLLSTGSLLIALAGCASTVPRPAPSAAVQNPPCPVASRLPPGSAPCAVGRTYSSTDLERTGDIDTADALQRLDPSITVQHH